MTIDLYRLTTASSLELAITIYCHGRCQKKGAFKLVWVMGSWDDGLTNPGVNGGSKNMSTTPGSSCILALNIVCERRLFGRGGETRSVAVKLSKKCQ